MRSLTISTSHLSRTGQPLIRKLIPPSHVSNTTILTSIAYNPKKHKNCHPHLIATPIITHRPEPTATSMHDITVANNKLSDIIIADIRLTNIALTNITLVEITQLLH
jgi:hypothetical protein